MPNVKRGMMGAAGAAGGGSASQGTLWTWGENAQGQLGHGNTTGLSSAAQLGSNTDWQSVDLDDYGICKIACSGSAVLAVDGDGKLWTWGSGTDGRGGRGNTDHVCVPTQVGTATDWSTVGGGYTMWAVKTTGEYWFIGGGNSFGQAGQNSTSISYYSSPMQIGTDTFWVKVYGSNYTSYAITNHGTNGAGRLYSLGSDTYGQLGHGTQYVYTSLPSQVGTDVTWTQVSAGNLHVLAIKSDGTLWAWGQNNKGQLGTNNTTNYCSPVQIGAAEWAYVSCDWQRSVHAVKTDGTLWGWGYNYYGSVGDGSTTDRSSPVQIGSLTDWKLVGSNSYTPTAIKTDGTLWSWGRGGTGNLGDGTTANRSSPVQVGSDTDWVSFGPNNQGWFKAGAIKSP